MSDTKKTCKNTKGKNQKTELNLKQRAFVNAYMINGFNATQAAIKAGYSKKTSESKGSQLLRIVKVQDEILKDFKKAGFMVQSALRENTKILESDIKNYLTVVEGGGIEFIPFNQLDPALTSNIKKIKNKRTIKENSDGSTTAYDEIELELYDKQKAISNIIDVAGIKSENLDITSNGEKIPQTVFNIIGKKNDTE